MVKHSPCCLCASSAGEQIRRRYPHSAQILYPAGLNALIIPLASIFVLLTGLYLVALAAGLWFSPIRATRFLSGFAGSALTHYLELVLRLIAGVAVLVYAPRMLFSELFALFGWLLVATTVLLFAVPWRWHRRFAQWGVPHATRNSRLLAAASFALGGIVIASVIL
jgi:hypothetical protein